MGFSTIINAAKGELMRPVKSMRTEWLNDKNGYTTKLLTVLEDYQTEEDKIDGNEGLSQQGKMEAKRAYATATTTPRLKFLRTEITNLQDKAQQLRTQFFTINSGIADVAERMPRYVYLWSRFDSLDQAERVSQFCQAAEADNILVLAAALEHPLGLVPEDVRARALTERAKRVFPKQHEAYAQIGLLLEYLTMMRDWIGRTLGVEIGVPIEAIRNNLGDEMADILTAQLVTGIPAAK